MKRRVSFEETNEAYRFALVGDDGTVFEIAKNTLAFSSNNFYRCFFKGLDEKPEYELLRPTEELQRQAKHVFETVEAIFKKACASIDATWFAVDEKQDDEPIDDLNERTSQAEDETGDWLHA